MKMQVAPPDRSPMTEAEANTVYDVLVQEVGAPEGDRDGFVYHQTNGVVTEYRFIGALGFGGKFWRNLGWYVNCYAEHVTPERDALMTAANERLAVLREVHG